MKLFGGDPRSLYLLTLFKFNKYFAAAVIMLIFVGIKFITASPEGKAEIKKTAIIYVVGAILLFAASGILAIIKNLAETNIK